MNNEEKKLDIDFRYEEIHKAALSAFAKNAMELDKILLGLSVGAIGFLLNFMLKDYSYIKDIYAVGVISFTTALGVFLYIIYEIIEIFRKNHKYFQSIISYTKGSDGSHIGNQEEKMKESDKRVQYSFLLAMILSTVFVLSQTINKTIVEFQNNNKIIVEQKPCKEVNKTIIIRPIVINYPKYIKKAKKYNSTPLNNYHLLSDNSIINKKDFIYVKRRK